MTVSCDKCMTSEAKPSTLEVEKSMSKIDERRDKTNPL